MRPDDDMKLGKILKANGGLARLLIGRGAMSVQWYPSAAAMARGLEKNAFSGAEYSLTLLTVMSLVWVLWLFWPFAALAVAPPGAFALNLLIIAWTCLLYVGANRRFYALPIWHSLTYPVGSLLVLWMIWRSCLLALWRGGVAWRGTHYSLRELRANRV
jgi:hypothetical protein